MILAYTIAAIGGIALLVGLFFYIHAVLRAPVWRSWTVTRDAAGRVSIYVDGGLMCEPSKPVTGPFTLSWWTKDEALTVSVTDAVCVKGVKP